MTIAKKTGWAQFTLAFTTSLLVLALPLAGSLLYFTAGAAPREAPSDAAPQTAAPLNLLAAKSAADGRPDLFVLARLDPSAGSITLCVLPPEMMVEDGGKFDALGSVWHRQGARRAVAALGGALGIGIDRWLSLSPASFIRLADTLGAVDYELAVELRLADGTVMLSPGRQLLDGRRLEALTSHTGYDGGEPERLALALELMVEALNQRLGLLSEAASEGLFQTAVNAGDSNLTVTDYEARRRSAAFLRSRLDPARKIPANGDYNAGKNTFLLSSESAEAIRTAFGG